MNNDRQDDDNIIEGELVDKPEPEKGSALAVQHGTMLSDMGPVITPEQAREASERYFALCEAILKPEDYQEYSVYAWDPSAGRKVKQKRKFKKKSAVKKLEAAFAISVEIKRIQRDDLGDGHYGYSITARATRPNGQFAEAVGACSTLEEKYDIEPYKDESEAEFAKRKKKTLARAYHDVQGTAETRASDRAIMNVIGVGGGEATAEEMAASRGDETPRGFEQRDRKPRFMTPQLNDEIMTLAMDELQIPSVEEWQAILAEVGVKEFKVNKTPFDDAIKLRDHLQELLKQKNGTKNDGK